VDDAPEPIAQDALDDLIRRLASTRRVRLPAAAPWTLGVDDGCLYELVDYWAREYDWRANERRIRDLPWRRVCAGGRTCRALVQEAGPDRPTVVLLHGWPDSVLRFERVLPLLSDFNVVVPALPGFPFAPPVDGQRCRRRKWANSSSIWWRRSDTTATWSLEAMSARGWHTRWRPPLRIRWPPCI
jgi:hypothetical protein